MFATVAIPFEAYRDLPTPQHRWLLICLARYVDRSGKCFPTQRQLAADARMSLSTVCRYLRSMADLGVFHRERRGAGRYVYTLAAAYVPRWPRSVPATKDGVPSPERGVSQGGTQEANPLSKTESSASADWEDRLRFWAKFRQLHWNPTWGPRPDEPGCRVPEELLIRIGVNA